MLINIIISCHTKTLIYIISDLCMKIHHYWVHNHQNRDSYVIHVSYHTLVHRGEGYHPYIHWHLIHKKHSMYRHVGPRPSLIPSLVLLHRDFLCYTRPDYCQYVISTVAANYSTRLTLHCSFEKLFPMAASLQQPRSCEKGFACNIISIYPPPSTQLSIILSSHAYDTDYWVYMTFAWIHTFTSSTVTCQAIASITRAGVATSYIRTIMKTTIHFFSTLINICMSTKNNTVKYTVCLN